LILIIPVCAAKERARVSGYGGKEAMITYIVAVPCGSVPNRRLCSAGPFDSRPHPALAFRVDVNVLVYNFSNAKSQMKFLGALVSKAKC
jgi:hypothetical protein